MTVTPTSPFADAGPGFNRDEAETVYGQLIKMDAGSAEVYGRMLVGAGLQYDLFTHEPEITAAISKALQVRTESLRASLIRTSIAKARAGQDNTAELDALIEVTKGFFGSLFSPAARSQRAHDQKRDPLSGRYQVMHDQVHIPHDAEYIAGRYAGRYGIPGKDDIPELENLTTEQKINFQHGYLQVQRMMEPWVKTPDDGALATVHYADDGPVTWFTVPKSGIVPVIGEQLQGGSKSTHGIDPERKVAALTVDIMPKNTAGGGIFTALNALGFPNLGSLAGGATQGGALDPARLKTFDESWNTKDKNDQFMPSNRVFRHLDTGSKLVEDTLGNTAPPHVKMALKVARHVGQLGPRAHKILAPTMDRAAYRYRGTERPLDKKLLDAVEQDRDLVIRRGGEEVELRRFAAAQRLEAKGRLDRAERERDQAKRRYTDAYERARVAGDRKGMKRAQHELDVAGQKLADAVTAHDAAGDEARIREERGDEIRRSTHVAVMRGGYGTKNNIWRPGEVLGYMRTRVPDPDLAELQLKSGVVPPSEGIIMSGDGTIKSQTVGYGDDHFLPFTLKNLAGLKGGYYIRTRTFGGPTSEDIYTALISGAKGLTVVSNNGVFTLDFEHDLKGGRRFNDKAARMVGRYGGLLDAVKSKQVGGGDISPARLREIHREAGKAAPNDAAAQKTFIDAQTARERANPTLSQEQREEVSRQYLNAVFEDRGIQLGGTSRPGMAVGRRLGTNAPTMQAMAQYVAHDRAEQMADGYDVSPQAVNQSAAGLLKIVMEDPARQIAEHLGVQSGLQQALQEAQDSERKKMQPLTLDGHGYDFALQALKEQFPYYIADTKWRPLRDGTDRLDTGYVKPKHNRPEDALAGYFDPDIGGTGKMTADSIRFQNGRTMQEAKVGTQAAAVDQVVAPGAPAAAGAAPAASPVETRNAADRAMLKHLMELREKPVGANFGDVPGRWAAVKDQPITGLLNQGVVPEAVKDFFRPAPAEMMGDQLRDPAAMRPKITAAVTWLENNNAYHGQWDQGVVANYRAGGKAEPIKALTGDDVITALKNPTRDWDLSGVSPVYMKGSGASADTIIEAYRKQQAIKDLIAKGELPDSPADGAAFTKAADALGEQLKIDDLAAREWDAEHMPPQPQYSLREVTMRGIALTAARQLQRRYAEASQAQFKADEAARLAEERAKPNVENNLLVAVVDQNGNPKAIDGPGGQAGGQIPGPIQQLIDMGVPVPPEMLAQYLKPPGT